MGGVDIVLSHVLKMDFNYFWPGCRPFFFFPLPHLAWFLSLLELSSFPDFSLSPLELWGPSQEL